MASGEITLTGQTISIAEASIATPGDLQRCLVAKKTRAINAVGAYAPVFKMNY
ncbi:hypothetical protein HCH_03980 [Hahella chejuensis KCTC 2396]|uniref:Uncharacterized protein n=1 Tax=Hahella chejuensis (strain KCTC 2396) TaxID=349521 RepID=Q2SF75_HAHCH|nr:hypothetical protein HCH_03980 [Hahella chejuensis KCTC 2396]